MELDSSIVIELLKKELYEKTYENILLKAQVETLQRKEIVDKEDSNEE